MLAGLALSANADVTTTKPGAILVFPKVISDTDTDTIIQLSNATGSRIHVRCFYLDGAINPETQQRLWLVTDFQITLTRLQPTVWVAGDGLPAAPPDRPQELYPGPVPPVSIGFLGELRCIVVNENEQPISLNALTGQATLIDRVRATVGKYQAYSVEGLPANNGDNTIVLNDLEYASCPRALLLNHFFDDAPDPILSSPVESRLTVVPCSMDLENSVPGVATLQFEVFNEFEQMLSASLPIICFEDIALSNIDGRTQRERSIFNFALQGTLVGHTRIRPVVDADSSRGHGILALAEELRDSQQIHSSLSLHTIGGNLQADVMVLPSPF